VDADLRREVKVLEDELWGGVSYVFSFCSDCVIKKYGATTVWSLLWDG
jgi:hypothetical protein